jgi:glutamate/tyrosine decarboxylase-like PLP-dependent enzyme
MTKIYENAIQEVERLYSDIGDLRVITAANPREITNHLADTYDFQGPVGLDDMVEDISGMLRKWSVQVTHPRYFGYFNPSVRPAAIVGDILTAAFNPNLAVWSHSPAGVEIEQHLLRYFLQQFGLDPERAAAHFTSGGAEANFTALVAALTAKLPEYGEVGLVGLAQRPVIYVSHAAHDSFGKICHMTGMGRDSLRKVDVDQNYRIDLGHLEKMIRADLDQGFHPLMVVGTAGTTAAGVIDPLEELSALSRLFDLWYHVDAAWGGAAVLSERLKPFLKGIEKADSITCDAHKWLSVPMGAGMFFSAHKEPCEKAFRIATDYMPSFTEGVIDPYTTSVQWSRRFIGLKVFMAFAELGHRGYAELIDHQARMGDYLKKELRARGWKILVDTPLPVASFTHDRIEKGAHTTAQVLDIIYGSGKTWISEIVLTSRDRALRACICSYRTRESDIDVLLEELEASIGKM